MSQINKYHSLILKSKMAPDLFVEIAELPATSTQETGLKDHSVFKYRLWYLSQSQSQSQSEANITHQSTEFTSEIGVQYMSLISLSDVRNKPHRSIPQNRMPLYISLFPSFGILVFSRIQTFCVVTEMFYKNEILPFTIRGDTCTCVSI